ncbi:MAG: sensor histidine kinase [Parvibaculaceae bacterium]
MSQTDIFTDDGHAPALEGTVLTAAMAVAPLPGVVHDLGNLIQVAASALNIISRSPVVDADPALESVVARAGTSLQRAGTLVEQTLRRAREGNAMSEDADIAECLMELRPLLEPAPDNIRLELHIGPDLPTVTCSRVSLQSAVLNLLFNARDAMPAGGLISVSAVAVHEGAAVTAVALSVADNGIGMTPDTVRRAADPFFTTKTTGLGGLGVPMVRRFLEEIGGRLDIESRPGAGTTVTLRLPIARRQADPAWGHRAAIPS